MITSLILLDNTENENKRKRKEDDNKSPSDDSKQEGARVAVVIDGLSSDHVRKLADAAYGRSMHHVRVLNALHITISTIVVCVLRETVSNLK